MARLVEVLMAVAVGAIASAAAIAAGPKQAVVLSTGARFDGALVAIDAQRGATFDVGGTTRSVPLAELVRWGSLVDPVDGPQLLLADGGVVIADVLESSEERLRCDTLLFGARSVPLELLRAIVFQPPSNAARRDRFVARLLDAKGDRDRLVLVNGDDLAGSIVSIKEKSVELESTVGKVTVDTSRIAGLAFDPSLVATSKDSGLRTLVGFRDGSRLLATKLEIGGDKVALSTGDGATWTAPLDSVVCLQPLAGQSKYLSDLPVESYRHLPFLSTAWPYHLDRSVTGGQLRAGGSVYAKGIGMHSTARLTFRLDRPYRRFEADIAIDDEAGASGSATFRVFVDGQQKFASEIIRGGAPPAPISVDVAGGKQLSLIVDFAERGDELDRADWLNARLVE